MSLFLFECPFDILRFFQLIKVSTQKAWKMYMYCIMINVDSLLLQKIHFFSVDNLNNLGLIQNHNHRNLKNFIYYFRQNHPDRED